MPVGLDKRRYECEWQPPHPWFGKRAPKPPPTGDYKRVEPVFSRLEVAAKVKGPIGGEQCGKDLDTWLEILVVADGGSVVARRASAYLRCLGGSRSAGPGHRVQPHRDDVLPVKFAAGW